MYQRGLLDCHQKHFVTANDFDKYVNHNLKIALPWINDCASKACKKSLVNAEVAFKRFFMDYLVFQNLRKNLNRT